MQGNLHVRFLGNGAAVTPSCYPEIINKSIVRIREEYKRSGYFWVPDKPSRKIPGTLTISDGGEIELEVIGLFDESIEALNGKDDLHRIIGHVEIDGYVTLENCFYSKKNISFGSISKSLVYVQQAFSGVGYDKDEIVTFNSVSFSIEGLNEWLSISGIHVSYGKDLGAALLKRRLITENQ